jgi:hypothetical protein
MQGQAARQGGQHAAGTRNNATRRDATAAAAVRGSAIIQEVRYAGWHGRERQAGRQAPVAGERPCLGRGGAGRGARASPGPRHGRSCPSSLVRVRPPSKLQTPGDAFSTLTNSKQIAVYNDDLFSKNIPTLAWYTLIN